MLVGEIRIIDIIEDNYGVLKCFCCEGYYCLKNDDGNRKDYVDYVNNKDKDDKDINLSK